MSVQVSAHDVMRDAPEAIDCLVIVVSYNNRDDVALLLDTLEEAANGLRVRVLVIENGSSTYGGEFGDNCSFVTTGRNLGYAGGLNEGLRHADGARSVLFLNPDVRLGRDSIRRLLAAAEDAGAGAAAPLMLDESGRRSFSLRREPSLGRALGEALLGDHWPHRPGWASEIVRDAADYTDAAWAEWATGAAILVTREAAAATGEWDAKRFFLYSEETDYCRRVREAGFGIRFEPRAVVVHRGAGSGTSASLVALMGVNRIRYFRKYHSLPASCLFVSIAVLHSLMRVNRPEERAVLKAVVSRRARNRLPGAPGSSP